ncbi:MAG: hypothetical protein FWG93_08085, partial [Oscillospiraceae bacterium]|nr:hypothetical protein [Oscillospiraceae bacterium]
RYLQLLRRAGVYGLPVRVLPVKTKKITFSAMMLALALTLLALTAVLPVMDLSLCAAASVCIALTVARCGLGYGAMGYAAAAVLAFLLLPDKASAVFFALAFGPYPLYRKLFTRVRPAWLRWAAKLAAANASVLLALALFRWAFADLEGPLWQMAGMLALYNAVMVLYDKAAGRVLERLEMEN